MDNCTRDLYADFMRNLQGCDTVTVSLEGVGETRYTTKEVYEAIDFRVNRRAQPEITGDTSDGYHTFNELYNHRAVLFSVICNDRPTLAWKSKQHHDGTMYDGMFIVGIETPEGQATYHYDVNPYWAMFRVPELPQAPEWDGHTPAQAIERIGRLTPQPENEPLTLEQLREMVDSDEYGVHIWVLKTVSRSVVSALTDVTCPDGVVAIWNANATENFKEKDYGQTWLAYRHKPAKEDSDGT